MASLHISLPEPMRAWIDEQVAQRGYKTASEYLCELVSDAQKRQTEERLEALLLEGINSGPPIEVTPEYWVALKERVSKRLAK